MSSGREAGDDRRTCARDNLHRILLDVSHATAARDIAPHASSSRLLGRRPMIVEFAAGW
jgi:hypothetical protein